MTHTELSVASGEVKEFITPSSHPFSTEGLLALRFFSAADTWLEKPIVIRTANSKWRMGFVIFLVNFTNLRLNLRKGYVR